MPEPFTIHVGTRFRRRAGFTLVEMLTVMGIIVILLAASLPALRGLNQSESRRGAVGTLLGALDQARMMAISNGLATYVVFACPANTNQINPDLLGRAYAIYQDNDNVSFNPVQKTPWLPLPKGISFKVQPVAAGGIANDCISARFASSTPTGADISFPLSNAALPANASTGATVQMPYWKFDGTGTVTEQNYLRLLIFPGIVVPGAGTGTGTEIATSQNTTAAGVPLYGQLEEIDMNPATGRAKYIIDPTNNLTSTLSTPSSTTSPSP